MSRTVPRATSAAVLAGGQSRRLGFPKAFLRLGGGRTLLEDTVSKLRRLSDDIMVVANEDRFDVVGARRVPDRQPGAAALGGIYTAIAEARHDRVLVVGCDMPFLSVRLLRWLIAQGSDHDVVVPRIGGYPEPLHALYGRACLGPTEARIRSGDFRIVRFFPEVRVRYVDEPELGEIDPELRSFQNANTPEALRAVAAAVQRDGPAVLRGD